MLSEHLRDQLLDYFDGQLNHSDQLEFEKMLADDPDLHSAWQSLRELRSAGGDWQAVEVPQWSRLQGVTARPGNNWSFALGWLSLATSTAAILLVLFQAQFQMNESGFSVSFNAAGVESTSEIDLKLAQLEQRQSAYVEDRMNLLEKKTQAMNRQLLTAALAYNREERRDDMRALASIWSRTRNTDLMRVDGIQDNQFDDRLAIRQLYTRISPIN